MADYRVVLCETCGSEGRLCYDTGIRCRETGAAMERYEPCPWCEGTGGEIIEVQPIEMEDLDIIAGPAKEIAE